MRAFPEELRRKGHDAAVPDSQPQIRRLANQNKVRRRCGLQIRPQAKIRVLLVHIIDEPEIGRRHDLIGRKILCRTHGAGDAALHVAGPASIQLPVRFLRGKRRKMPERLVAQRDCIDVPAEQDRSIRTPAGQLRNDVVSARRTFLLFRLDAGRLEKLQNPVGDRALMALHGVAFQSYKRRRHLFGTLMQRRSDLLLHVHLAR